MAKFKIGSICVIIGSDNHPELIGTEVTITEVTITGAPVDCFNLMLNKRWTGYPTDLVYSGQPICPK